MNIELCDFRCESSVIKYCRQRSKELGMYISYYKSKSGFYHVTTKYN